MTSNVFFEYLKEPKGRTLKRVHGLEEGMGRKDRR